MPKKTIHCGLMQLNSAFSSSLREVDIETLRFHGPLRFSDIAVSELPEKPGVYLWCIEIGEGLYRVHYVGEALDIQRRSYQHMAEQLAGKYHAFSPEALRKNVKVLVHRAHHGVVNGRSQSAKQANRDYLDCLSIFYATHTEHAAKDSRCQFETAIAHAIEDHGQNVLSIGHLRHKGNVLRQFRFDAGDSSIEALTGVVLEVGTIVKE